MLLMGVFVVMLTCISGNLVCADQTCNPPVAHTFSIVAYDEATGDVGVATATKLPAVGMYVPFAKAGVGAIASQAIVNPEFGPKGLELLAQGLSAEEVKNRLIGADPMRDHRQLIIVDTKGGVAAFSGKKNSHYYGHSIGKNMAVAGNLLAGEECLKQMAAVFRSTTGRLSDKLLAALEAGEAAGGDRRGKQSAAILVTRPGAYFQEKFVDLRVDDNAKPVRELRRIYNVYMATFLHLPGYRDLSTGKGDDVATLQKWLKKHTFYRGEIDSIYGPETQNAVKEFQKAASLPVTGKVDVATSWKLEQWQK